LSWYGEIAALLEVQPWLEDELFKAREQEQPAKATV
jgi:hypothetical protein